MLSTGNVPFRDLSACRGRGRGRGAESGGAFPPILDTPAENIAKALVNAPPKKDKDGRDSKDEGSLIE